MNAFGTDIAPAQICIIKAGASKHEALDQLVEATATHPCITDREALRRAVHEREAISSTGIGGGVAIPHVRLPELPKLVLAIGIAPKGIEFDTLDNKPVYIMVLFVTPKEKNKEYLGHLAQVMQALRDPELFQALVACHTPGQADNVLNVP